MNTTNLYEVDVIINNKPIRKYIHKNQLYIEARKGDSYEIRIRNNGYRRILVVVTTDGINVISGEAGGNSLSGYVISPFNSYRIKGFRTSNDSINKFVFSEKNESYAAKSQETKGDILNCGVIGIKIYDEIKQQPLPFFINNYSFSDYFYPESYLSCKESNYTSCCNNTLQCSSQEESNNFDIGTRFSKIEVQDKVSDTEFIIGNLLDTTIIFYASKNSLISMGVPIHKEVQIVKMPNAFPSNFCKPPINNDRQ